MGVFTKNVIEIEIEISYRIFNLNMLDYWYRYEWKHRGSVHVHRIRKKKNALKIDWNAMKDNKDEMNNIIQYLDSIVITINPDMYTPIPESSVFANNHQYKTYAIN
ncbi:hypothetical protein RhiirA5_443163 [Rhizophagus irregularis]|uniref:Uncharacterized protein n=1 Tax=Rhizophagus irregularis TaxID=588596 RepID=A0A2N0NE90_9GLOM|nr:hypothetical protein RhiirA5_443163 [Rhizophagus irregularis]